jgi:hypothetical protein
VHVLLSAFRLQTACKALCAGRSNGLLIPAGPALRFELTSMGRTAGRCTAEVAVAICGLVHCARDVGRVRVIPVKAASTHAHVTHECFQKQSSRRCERTSCTMVPTSRRSCQCALLHRVEALTGRCRLRGRASRWAADCRRPTPRWQRRPGRCRRGRCPAEGRRRAAVAVANLGLAEAGPAAAAAAGPAAVVVVAPAELVVVGPAAGREAAVGR